MSRTGLLGLVLVLALGAALAGCGGDAGGGGGVAVSGGTPEPSSATTSPGSVPPEALILTFATAGGCLDAAEPSGCGEHPYGAVADQDVRALLHDAAPRLSRVEPGPNGCGDEFVDGVSVRVHVERLVIDEVELLEVCLSSVPADDQAGAALWRLYADARDTTTP